MSQKEPASGYSKRSLVQKLGIRAGCRYRFVNAPKGYSITLGALPPGCKRVTVPPLDFVQIFSRREDHLADWLPKLKDQIARDGMIWVSWPKKSSGVVSDLTEDVVRKIALPLHLVDIKVCAVDEIWSGLKLVIRREFR